MNELDESQIESLAVQRYGKNVEYFKEHHKELYEKLLAFDLAVEQGHYKTRYDLVLTDGYFDVLELSSGNHLYSSSSDEYANDAKRSVDFVKSSNVFECFKDVEIKEKDLLEYEKLEITENNLSGFAPILSMLQKNSSSNRDFKKIEKFVFFGVGLGGHIKAIDEKISADIYLIVEDDLELFKLSLFTTPFYELSAKLIFSVLSNSAQFTQDTSLFLESGFEKNHYIKYFQMLSHSEEKLKAFHIQVSSQTHNLFYYSEILKQYIKPLDYLTNNYNFLNIVKLNANAYFNSKPVLLLAAGPSLSKNIKWLQKNHKKFIIVALSATLRILEKHKIVPDVVTHIDGLATASVHFNKLKSLAFLKDSLCLFSAKTSREIVDKVDKNRLFFFENGTSYKKDFGNLTAPCVGSTTYLLLLVFKVKELYLLGLDLALDSQTLSTHAEGHEYSQKLKVNSMDEDSISYKKSIIKSVGNFQEEIFTTPEYKFSIDSINTSSQSFKSEEQNVYNLSDGALFSNTIPTPAKSVRLQTIDKKALKDELYSIFALNASNQMMSDEVQALHDRDEYALSVKDIIVEQENSDFISEEEFLNSLTLLSDKLARSNSTIEHDLALVYENYLKFIYTFIFDFFNTKDAKYEKSFIKRLNKELCKQLLRIESIYESALEVQDVETLAMQRYEKNIEYIGEKHPELMQKLLMFDRGIAEGKRFQMYDLEYLDNYFDIKELKSSHYLYAGDTNEISRELSRYVDFKKDSNIFEGFPLYNFVGETLENLDDKSRCLDGVYPIMNYYIANSNMDDTMREIKKFIFLGVGLGIHIPFVQDKVGVREALIVEDDLEIFKLSLFCTEYYTLAQQTNIYFSVAQQSNSFLQIMNLFLENSFIDNRYLKYQRFPAHSRDKLQQIQNALSTQSFVTFPYKTELEKFIRPLEYINDGYNVVNLAKNFSRSIFEKKPVLLLGAGPSLHKNIEWLQANHKRFIIIAVSATLKTLFKHNIVPDVVTHLDGFHTSMVHYEGFDAKEFLKDTSIVMGPFSPSVLRTMFSKEKIFYYEENTSYFDGFGSIVAPCIGSFSLLLSLKLNTQELYLLGLDLAVEQSSGATHGDAHAYAQEKDMSQKERLQNVISLKDNLFGVDGNFEKTVYTTSVYHQSIHALFNSIPQYKSETQTIYNLSDGAHIEKTTPKHIEKIDVSLYAEIDKKSLQEEIVSSLEQNSTKELSAADKDSIHERLKNAKKVQGFLVEYTQNVSYATSQEYMDGVLELVQKLLIYNGRDSINLTHVYYHFFKYTLPIIVDFFNNENLKDEIRHIKAFDKMLCEEMFVIQNIYEGALQKFIESRF